MAVALPKTSRLLKPRKINAILNAIKKGMPPHRAARLFKVSDNAWTAWKQATERDHALGVESVFTRFFDRVGEAESEYMNHVLEKIENTLDKAELRDLVLILERRFPDEYRKRETQEVIARRGVPAISEVLTTEVDELTRAAQLLALMEENQVLPALLPPEVEAIDIKPA